MCSRRKCCSLDNSGASLHSALIHCTRNADMTTAFHGSIFSISTRWLRPINLANVKSEIDDVALVLILLATDSADFNEDMYSGNQHLLNLSQLGQTNGTS